MGNIVSLQVPGILYSETSTTTKRKRRTKKGVENKEIFKT